MVFDSRIRAILMPEDEGQDSELFLLQMRYNAVEELRLEANQAIQLDKPDHIWVIFSGEAEVFQSTLSSEGEPCARYHLFTVRGGALIFGFNPEEVACSLLLIGTSGCRVLRITREYLDKLIAEQTSLPHVAAQIDQWIYQLSNTIAPLYSPRVFVDLTAGEMAVEEDVILRSRRFVFWVDGIEGNIKYLGRDDLLLDKLMIPVVRETWLEVSGGARIVSQLTKELLAQGGFWEILWRYHALVGYLLAEWASQREQAERKQVEEMLARDVRQLDESLRYLASTLTSDLIFIKPAEDHGDNLFEAMRCIGEAVGITIQAPARAVIEKQQVDPLGDIVRASRIRHRRVSLTGAWYKNNSGPLLGFAGLEQTPVALLPDGVNRYRLFDPATNQSILVDEEANLGLANFAYVFYRPFTDEAIGVWKAIKFALKGTSSDIRQLIIAGMLAGIVALVIPVLTGTIFNAIIPAGNAFALAPVAFTLAISAGAVFIFEIVRGIAQLRLETRTEANLQAAVMDRLLTLSPNFFRAYNVGDLGERALSISTIRMILSRTVLNAVLALIFSLSSFVLLWFYSTRLALMASILVVVLMMVTLWAGISQARHQREQTALQGKISGIVLQYIRGIAKLHAAGAERRAFTRWAISFAELMQVNFRIRVINNLVLTFNQVFNVITLMVLFGVIALSAQAGLKAGDFLAFNAAFTQFLLAAMGVAAAVGAIMSLVPLYERAQPILRALPENVKAKPHPGELTGQIEIDHVNFRYDENGPLILNDVSMHFEPGQFVALVGPSGSGKSTVMRLLLGFEKAESGSIFFDQQDITETDLQAVRQQIGVVLQNAKVMQGDIFSNIVGSAPLAIEDAWQAAEMAGLAEDIRNMPMGMHTMVAEGGGTLSGGQRQRLLIAAALVRKPRIIVFDEATSALDNNTQQIVSNSLASMEATRIVVAHRLSTIRDADYIYVLERGEVVEEGTYQDLMVLGGIFARLAKRQLI